MAEIPIIGPPSASFGRMMRVVTDPALGATDWYLNAVLACWHAGMYTGVDPLVLCGQCAHETAWGRFGGVINGDYGNLAGMKIRTGTGDLPEAHAKFAMDRWGHPWLGAIAQAHHLMLYAGVEAPFDTPDERAHHIGPGSTSFGSARTVEALGGKWAPSATYGTMVASKVRKLRGEPSA